MLDDIRYVVDMPAASRAAIRLFLSRWRKGTSCLHSQGLYLKMEATGSRQAGDDEARQSSYS